MGGNVKNIFKLGRNKVSTTAESQTHVHGGDVFNIHVMGDDTVQIYRHGYFEQLSRKDAAKYLADMRDEISQIITTLERT